jgi:membrane fusion protein (multidrug efflux system)
MATVLEADDTRGGSAPLSVAGASTPDAAPAPGGRKRMVYLIVALAALALVGFGIRQWWFGRSHVGTDDAQVEGHITPILPRVGGYVADIRVQENQQVKAGDTLVVLDDRDLRAKLAQADAELNALLASTGAGGKVGQATAQIGVAQAGAQAAQATIAQARANARKAHQDLERMRTLADRAIISRQQLDAAQAAADAADAQLVASQQNAQAAGQQVTAAQAGLQAADARVAAARAARDQVALQLSYTRVVAPASGMVTKKNVEVGQLVQPGQPLMTVVPLNDTWVVANLKETDIEKVRAGDDVEFTLDAYPGHSFHGRVESLSPATGAKFSLLPPDNATGNYTKVVQRIPVRIRLSGAPEAGFPLRPGMSAVVTITTK